MFIWTYLTGPGYWTSRAVFQDNPLSDQQCGRSIAVIDQQTVVVGCSSVSANTTAIILTRQTNTSEAWSQAQHIARPSSSDFSDAGANVAVSANGQHLAIGAPRASDEVMSSRMMLLSGLANAFASLDCWQRKNLLLFQEKWFVHLGP
jgi:hypothetical protein